MTPRLSVVVCTFNPAPRLLGRCLEALATAERATPFAVEIVIVDNNSHPALGVLGPVVEFLRAGASRRLINEPRQGLTHARLRGLASAQAPALIFIDDDNLVATDYFVAAADLLARISGVGVWGPGIIDVEWESGTSRWIRGYAACFQQRRATSARFEATAGWLESYPTGTGMIVRREVLAQYARQLEAGRLSAVGRKGGQMTSGEDAQIVWTAVQMGLSAGISPALRLTHFVERRKAALRYILRMVFATMASGRVALRESFPDRPDLWAPATPLVAQGRIVALALKQLLLLRLRSGPVQVVRELGDVHGQFLAARRRPPWLTRVAARATGFAWVP